MTKYKNSHLNRFEKPLDVKSFAHARAAFLKVEGMMCERCALRVHDALLKMDGILLVEVSAGQGLTVAAFNADRIAPELLETGVSRAGQGTKYHYEAKILAVMDVNKVFKNSQ